MQLYRLLARRSVDATSVRAIAATLIAIACLAVALGVLRVEREHEVLALGYRLSHETQKRDELLEVRRRLELERAALTTPDRIRRLATALGMTTVAPDRIRVVKRGPIAMLCRPKPEASRPEVQLMRPLRHDRKHRDRSSAGQGTPRLARRKPRLRDDGAGSPSTARAHEPAPASGGIGRAAKIRAVIAGAILSLAVGGVGYRAWKLQVDDADHYRAIADRQHEVRIAVPAPRGDIIDALGNPLAISADVDSVWASPRDVQDVTAAAERLAHLLPGDAAGFEAKLGSPHRFVWLARHVSPDVAAAVRAAKLPGIEVVREPRRWYPARSLAGPVLGGADVDGKGIDGIEKALDVLLAGKQGEATALRDARGHAMFEDGRGAEPGATVQLTIDRNIEAIADAAIAEAVVSHQATSGVAVVLDVSTSRVLALASYPTFDPNVGAGSGARDRPVTDAYEAGSVMKVFSVAVALDAGVVTPDTLIDVGGGQFKLGPKVIHDVEHDSVLTVGGVVKRSSNVGAAKIALRLGREPLYAGLQRFGFGARSGIELPGEQTGMLRDGARPASATSSSRRSRTATASP